MPERPQKHTESHFLSFQSTYKAIYTVMTKKTVSNNHSSLLYDYWHTTTDYLQPKMNKTDGDKSFLHPLPETTYYPLAL